ncbi:MAG: RNA-binding S4 domain-containing protein [Bacteroidota bacterium]|jgi:ribosome-associated heat shock protein Hsp15
MSRLGGEDPDPGLSRDTGRLDRWLWFARVVKSRTLAAGLVEEGKVRLNRARISKPSQAVRVGDVLTIRVGPRVRILRVARLGQRRGPPAEAQTLYEELLPQPVAEDAAAPVGERLAGSGRPTKRERRQIGLLKGE